MRKLLLGLILALFAGPVSAQSILSGSGGGGIVSGTTTITGGADTQVCFNDAGFLSCGDAGLTYNKTTDTLTVGAITMTVNLITGSANGTGIGFGGSSNASPFAVISTTLTPDGPLLTTGSTANSWHMVESADSNFDFNNCSAGTSAAPDPLWCVHSRNQSTTQWVDFSHDGTNANINVGTGILNVNGFVRSKSGELALNADYTNATGTMSNTALSTTVTSGRTYSFSMELLFADSTAADGILVDFDGGAAAMTNFRVQCNAANAVGAALAFTTAGSTAIATDIDVTLALTTQAGLTCHGTFVPSSTSTFIVRASQKAHTAGTLTIFRGSWLNIRDASPL